MQGCAHEGALERVRRELEAIIFQRDSSGGWSEDDKARYQQLCEEEQELLAERTPTV